MAARYFSKPPQQIPSKEVLTDVLLFEIVNQFRIKPGSALYRLIHWLGKAPASRFADIMQRFDHLVAERSLWEASRDVLPHFTSGFNLYAEGSIPKEGPLLVVSNHPGAADSIAAMASVERSDTYLMVIEHSMLTAMPNLNRRLINLVEENPFRYDVMQDVIQKLRNGKSVIIFPRGNLEPDPALYPGVLTSLQEWSSSIGLFLSKVPETFLQPLLMSNVVSPRAWNSLIAKSARSTKTRHQIAMVLQIALQRLMRGDKWKIPIKVNVPMGLTARELDSSLGAKALNQALRAYIKEAMISVFPKIS